MMDDLTPVLSRLPEPMPSSTLTATVMARIEREAERNADARVVAPASRARELRTWLLTFVGVALALTAFVNGWLSSGTLPNFTAPRIGVNHAPLMPIGPGVSVLLALGLLVYVVGLFAPLRSDRT